ncbi:hypothetical protein KIPB_005584 [Kipferlia bialata]|uniref:Uncharacterized protein n=1 Tax=Kipferlia bialata TaxID=797122 RepID=A0A9K3CXL5_9EUKA|nr:hypothetical protein KIPB_005584 [Kipferlia bialata]|eukprot:g5584.t1
MVLLAIGILVLLEVLFVFLDIPVDLSEAIHALLGKGVYPIKTARGQERERERENRRQATEERVGYPEREGERERERELHEMSAEDHDQYQYSSPPDPLETDTILHTDTVSQAQTRRTRDSMTDVTLDSEFEAAAAVRRATELANLRYLC